MMLEQSLALPKELRIVELTAQQAQVSLADLLLLADEDPKMLARYQSRCRYWAIHDRKQHFLAEVAVQQRAVDTWEIMNIAVTPAAQGQGLGSILIRLVLLMAQQNDQAYLLVGTGDTDLANLSFYLHNGFRFYQIRPNFFKEYQMPIVVDGLPLQDMIMFRQPVTKF
ncbi:GNAT family N-acetyltransferase [Lapidilactobacillus gannanensis]|jgi:ribosomal protein S18 acetylase RimI-like enzyme|uniref:GNAT family N-acetyltransferase n=1 Tax=Lapidilactobacillus gannanensis TaxID=2486002 RepID=A0ABW4BKC0_9LACO|nr:GNAT family N-acetyltransferase [Lapidilactobacillus gannanensis]MCH4056746.1 GNAT family N-acetyltransferase [Lactobacillaceae bacterium]